MVEENEKDLEYLVEKIKEERDNANDELGKLSIDFIHFQESKRQ